MLGREACNHAKGGGWTSTLAASAGSCDGADSAALYRGRGVLLATFTDEVIRTVGAKDDHVVFILWGSSARKKKQLLDTSRHTVIESPHPSPLSAHRGFFGSRPFSTANAALEAHGQPPIDWSLG